MPTMTSIRPRPRARAADASSATETDPLGGSSRLTQLLTRMEKLLTERYAFDVFAENAINFGIMVTYRQTWKPREVPGGRPRHDHPAGAEGDPPLHHRAGDQEDAGGEGDRGQPRRRAKTEVERHDARRRRDRQEGAGEDELQHDGAEETFGGEGMSINATQSGGGEQRARSRRRPRRSSARAC